MQEVAENIFVATYFRGPTVAAILTDEGFVLIDAPPFPEDARRWRALLQTKSNLPIRALILTDYHNERLLGAYHMQAAVVIAHRTTYEHIKNLPANFAGSIATMLTRVPYEQAELHNSRIVLPQVTFDHKATLHFGAETLYLEHKPGPTKGSILARYPQHNMLFAGDVVVVGSAPYLNSPHSSMWLETLQEISRPDYSADIIIPGHGNITVKTAIDPVVQFLETARERIRAMYEAGQSMSDTARLVHELLNFFPPPLESELSAVQQRVRIALQSIYNELRQPTADGYRDNDFVM